MIYSNMSAIPYNELEIMTKSKFSNSYNLQLMTKVSWKNIICQTLMRHALKEYQCI